MAEKTYKFAYSKDETKLFDKNKVVRITLTDDQRDEILKIIENEKSKILAEYQEYGYYDKLEKSLEELEGIKHDTNFPVEGASNRKVLLLAIMSEIVASRAVRQTMGANPMFLLEQDGEADMNELRERMDHLDFVCRKKVKYDEFVYPVYRMSCVQGVSIVKAPVVHEVEYYVYKQTYTPDPESIAKFEGKYAEKLMTGSKKETEAYKRLALQDEMGNLIGETIIVEEEEPKVVYHGTKPYRVPPEKFFARLKIKDLRQHLVISEQMDYTWQDITSRVADGYYDEDVLDKIRDHYSKDKGATKDGELPEYMTRPYNVFESICMVRLPKDDEEREVSPRRYIITYDADSKIVLRCVYYPFRHCQICYIPYTAIPRDDMWMGYSFYERIVDTISIAEKFLNASINEFTLAHTPVILTDDSSTDFSRKEVKGSSINVISMEKGSRFEQMRFEYAPVDRVGMMQWAVSFGELISGVSASLSSGAEQPLDPRAPAMKTAIKQRASNMRMEDTILNLQKGDQLLAEQIDKNDEQFPDERDLNEEKTAMIYFVNDEKKEMPMKSYEIPVRYVCHGSRLSFDRYTDLQVVMQTTAYLAQFYPEVMQDYGARYTLLEAYMNSTEGSVERKKMEIMQPLKYYVDAQKAMKEMLAQGGQMNTNGLLPQGGQPAGAPQGGGMEAPANPAQHVTEPLPERKGTGNPLIERV